MDADKISYLNQRLNNLAERFSHFVDPSILKERDRLLAYFDGDFVQKRSPTHLLRLLLSQHLQRKKLLGSHPLTSKNRAVEFRILPVKLQYPFVSKKVVGILVQMSLSNRYDLFDEEIFQRSVHQLLPTLHMVRGSLYKFQGNNDNIHTLYAEFEKPGNNPLTATELGLLKKNLGEELIDRTEKLVPAIFKVRNQEEALRNILTLSQEIDHLSDLPQVMISFETQSSEEFTFTVIGVRAENQLSIALDNLIQQGPSCRWILERKQIVRYLQDHEPIVAYLFRVLLMPDNTILRSDGSLNFFAARQKVAATLKESIGDYRDFNGGILIKQEETLLSLKNAFPHIPFEQIENIFYSITPIEMQTILQTTTLQSLIDLAIQASHLSLISADDYHLVSSSKPPFLIVVLRIPSGPLYEKAKHHLQLVEFPENIQASFSLHTKDSYLFGYLLPLEDKRFYDRFIDSINKLLAYWSDEVKKLKILRLSLNTSINSLDPRIGGDAVSSIFLKMLFEGLTRIGPDGKLELAIAEKVELSEDQKTYLFHLRPTTWSNGDPLTSYDFEYAWKKILSPNFNAPHNYLFFCIKNAEKAKKNSVSIQDIGICAINDHLLKVELSFISPHFLELLTLPIFFPVHALHDTNTPNWPLEEGARYISNGAFKVEKNYKDSNYEFVKNPLYWEKDKIQLDQVIIARSHHSRTQELFLQNQTHWLGAPLGAWDIQFKPGPTDVLMTYPDNGLLWAACQADHPLLKNKNIRKALSYAIDREALLQMINYPNSPAFSPLPPVHSQIKEDPYPFSPEKASELWKKGLSETGFSQYNLPSIEIAFTGFSSFGKQTAEFLCESWRRILHANSRIRGFEFKALLSSFASNQFDIGLIRWQPWVNDPFYTLNCFTSVENIFNFSHLIGTELIEQIKAAQEEKDLGRRQTLIKQIEEQLVDDTPVVPLFNTYYQSIRKKKLKININHTLIDFKWARIETE